MAFAAIPLVIGLAGGLGSAGVISAAGITAITTGTAFSIGFLASITLYSAFSNRGSGSRFQALAKELVTPAQTPGIPMPIVYGTKRIGTLIGSYSDFKSYKNEGSGGGSGLGGGGGGVTSVTYKVRLQLAMCFGVVDKLWDIDIGRKSILRNTNGYLYSDYTGAPVQINTKLGTIEWFWGTSDQPISYYYDRIIGGEKIHFNNICHFCTYGTSRWTLGTSPNLQSIAVTVSRYPKTILSTGNTKVGDSWSANPAAVIFDIMTNPYYGLRIPYTQINVGSFEAAAKLFNSESFGINMILDQNKPAVQYLVDIFNWTNCYLYTDQTGRIAIKVIRENGSNKESNLIKIDDAAILPGTLIYNKKAFSSTINRLNIEYESRANKFQTEAITLFDQAKFQAQLAVKSETINLAGLNNPNDAIKQANRIMAQKSNAVAKCTFETNKTTNKLWIGRRVWVKPTSWPQSRWFIGEITDIEEQNLQENKIKVTVIEDVLTNLINMSLGANNNALEDQNQTLAPFTRVHAFELTSTLSPVHASEPRIVFMAGQEPNISITGFEVWAKKDAVNTDYSYIGTSTLIVPAGKIISYINNTDPTSSTSTTFNFFTDGLNDEILVSQNDDQWSEGGLLAVIEGELISIRSIQAQGSNEYKAVGLKRGFYGTSKVSHAIDTPVFFLTTSQLSDYMTNPIFARTTDYTYKLLPILLGTTNLVLSDISSTLLEIT